MKKTAEIEIAGKSYPLKFGFGAFRLLGENWQCVGVQSVVKKFQEIIPQEKEGEEPDITFSAADKMADVAFAGMINAGVKELPDTDDCAGALIFGGQLEKVMTAFSESLPKQEGNPQPEKKIRQTKKAKK